ncbi:MAG TPA: aminodeoxychorismate/anthranilate synthase component II [Saprospiraceae bacterium]|nr:aminodeoxychorismate/anthranilate synthase component II [Saprospiraceae bacterium]HMQ85823.1 aminodeoxychorismate/anthranilate synthase component II [Saprospiraceae bacterium]
MKILVLDNYDSFTFNLVQYIQEILGQKIDVFRNDAIGLDAVQVYDAIVLSPGPGLPKDAGIMPHLIKRYAPEKPIFGVCLGHQAIGEAFGGELENLSEVYHGVETDMQVLVKEEPLFTAVPEQFRAGRYHSWAVKKTSLPDCLEITAIDENGAIMAMRHRAYNVRGVQFHPESIMTQYGKQMLENFFSYCVQPVFA